METTTLTVTIRRQDAEEFYSLVAPLLARVAQPDEEPTGRQVATTGWKANAEQVFTRAGFEFTTGEMLKALTRAGYTVPRSSFIGWLNKAVDDGNLIRVGEGFSTRYRVPTADENAN